MALDQLTDDDETIGIAGVSIATSILENLSSNVSEDQNTNVSVQILT